MYYRADAFPADRPKPDRAALTARTGLPARESGLALYRYWLAIKADRPAPTRADFDPLAVKELLPCVFIAKREAETFRFTLFGTGAAELYGKDLTGLTLEEAGFGGHLPVVRALYDQVLRQAEPMLLTGTLDWRDKPYLGVEILHLPLACRGPKPSKILGLMVERAPEGLST